MTNQSILIIGKDINIIEDKIGAAKKDAKIKGLKHTDFFEIKNEDKTIGIDKVREIKVFAAKKPFSAKRKLIVIWDAHKLTIEAQNALLKILEEPNASSQIILVAENEQKILPTVLSRCQKIKASEEFTPKKVNLDLATKFLNAKVGERFDLIEGNSGVFSERENLVEFINTLIYLLRNDLSSQSLRPIAILQRIKKDVESTNINLRLAAEYVATALI